MSVERLYPLAPSPVPQNAQYNVVGDEQRVISPDTGRKVVSRQDETAKSGQDAKEQELNKQDVEKLAERLNRVMGLIEKRLHFTVHDKSKIIQVKVIDQHTGEVLDEIPPKRLLDLMSSFQDLTGLFVDHKA